MSERVQAYFEALKRTSSKELDASARNLAVEDKVNDAEIIAILTELRDRDYHKELKYPNLFRNHYEALDAPQRLPPLALKGGTGGGNVRV